MRLFFAICATVLFTTCSKTGSDYAECFKNFHLTLKDTVVYAGDSVTIYASSPGAAYQWRGPGNFLQQTEGVVNYITIPAIKLSQGGKYSCAVTGIGCNPAEATVNIHVRYAQGMPPCNAEDNTIANTIGVPDIDNAMVYRGYDLDINAVSLSVYAGVGYPEIYFYFNTNGKNEPEDGIYLTKDLMVFDQQDEANTVNVACNYFPFYLESHEGQKVYVSHKNGKLRVNFCSLKLSDGIANGTISGQVTEK